MDHSPLFDELLKDTGAAERLNDPRFALGVDVAKAKKAATMVPSIARAADIFKDVARQRFPKDADIERMAREGKHFDPLAKTTKPGHRRRVEYGTLEMDSVVGKISESQFVFNLCVGVLDCNDLSTFGGRLQKDEQTNGRWVPVHIKTWEDRRVTRNGRKVLTRDVVAKMADFPRSQTGEEIVEWIGGDPEVPADVGETVLGYAIVWMDVLNAEDLPQRDWTGKAITQTTVVVENSAPAGLVEATMALADAAKALAPKPEAPGAGDASDARLAAVLAELEEAKRQLAVLTEPAPSKPRGKKTEE